MKIAVSSSGKSLDSALDPRFGRCTWFLVVDPANMSCEVFDNQNAAPSSGAGQFLNITAAPAPENLSKKFGTPYRMF